eukprot:scaffold96125_cov30-Phaeocystis_antarctica.AAC.2
MLSQSSRRASSRCDCAWLAKVVMVRLPMSSGPSVAKWSQSSRHVVSCGPRGSSAGSAQSLAELITTDFARIPYAVAAARMAEDISPMELRPYSTRCVFGGSLIQSSPCGHSGFL